jgi:peptidyl-prolyl cis-trans isomerase C
MKILIASLVFCALLCGQAAAPGQPPSAVKPSVTPGAPTVNGPAGAPPASSAATPPAATPPAPIAPDTVVAEVNGKKYTAAEIDKIISTLPPQYQGAAKAQPQMLSQVFLMQRLAEDAEKAGLDKRDPFKDQLEITRMQVLSTAELSEINNTMKVTEEEEEKYYKDNPDKFKEVKVRAIHIGFAPVPPKPPGAAKAPEPEAKPAEGKLTEAEAKAKMEDIEKQIKAGADFGKLAREVSDDKESAAKDGDFGTIKQESPYPPLLKSAVFALKQGEMTAPLRQPNGFYLLRAEEVSMRPFQEVQAQVVTQTKQEKYQAWLTNIRAQYSVKIENPAYFSGPRVPPLLQTH